MKRYEQSGQHLPTKTCSKSVSKIFEKKLAYMIALPSSCGYFEELPNTILLFFSSADLLIIATLFHNNI